MVPELPINKGKRSVVEDLAKQMYLRMSDQVRPENPREWETMIYAVEQITEADRSDNRFIDWQAMTRSNH